jgi:hypothetical protein
MSDRIEQAARHLMRQAGLFSEAVHAEVEAAELCKRGVALDRAIDAMEKALAPDAQPRGDTVSCPKHGRKELREDGDTYFCPECNASPTKENT